MKNCADKKGCSIRGIWTEPNQTNIINTYALLAKRVVEMTRCWQSSFSFYFTDRDEVEVTKNAKKEGGQYPIIFTKQAW